MRLLIHCQIKSKSCLVPVIEITMDHPLVLRNVIVSIESARGRAPRIHDFQEEKCVVDSSPPSLLRCSRIRSSHFQHLIFLQLCCIPKPLLRIYFLPGHKHIFRSRAFSGLTKWQLCVNSTSTRGYWRESLFIAFHATLGSPEKVILSATWRPRSSAQFQAVCPFFAGIRTVTFEIMPTKPTSAMILTFLLPSSKAGPLRRDSRR